MDVNRSRLKSFSSHQRRKQIKILSSIGVDQYSMWSYLMNCYWLSSFNNFLNFCITFYCEDHNYYFVVIPIILIVIMDSIPITVTTIIPITVTTIIANMFHIWRENHIIFHVNLLSRRWKLRSWFQLICMYCILYNIVLNIYFPTLWLILQLIWKIG